MGKYKYIDINDEIKQSAQTLNQIFDEKIKNAFIYNNFE